MWRLNHLPLRLASEMRRVVKKRGCVSDCLENARHLWCGVKNDQLGPLAQAKPSVEKCSVRVGQEIEGFVVDEVGDVPEYRLTAYRLHHIETGAQYLHIDRHDTNNVFSTHFRTTPTDSTGLPHILEHTTLCGSERFPVRDPFMKMLVRSMATFINAMTGPDYTVYPFSTQNRQDFNNLMSVYLDLVFRPKLRELDFKQEGWRLEHAKVDDKCSPVIFKGVVFNEMKGVFAENASIFSERLLNSILPSHTYGVISGGDPLVIPSLTHEDLVAFHRNYYQPANARFYSYGNFPMHEHLKYLSKSYLASSTPVKAIDTSVPPEPRWTSERREHYTYRPDRMAADPQKQSSLAVGFLGPDISNRQDVFELDVISELLVKGPNSAFYRTLVEPNIGAGLSPVTGYTSETRDTFFAVGLQGMSSTDFEKVIDIIEKTLADVVNNGFNKEHLEEVLHGIELGMAHQSTNFGMHILFHITPVWNHDADLLLALRQADQVAKLRKNLQNNPRYLQDKVKKYLVGNSHRLVLTMSPDENYEAKQAKAEADMLAEKVQKLSSDQRESVYKQGLELLEIQQTQEDISVLPTLHVSDISDEVERYDLQMLKFGRIPLQFSAQPTNGVTYLRGVVNTSHLSHEQNRLFSLFCSVAAKMGTKDCNFRKFDHLVKMKTGGLGISVQSVNHSAHLNKFEEGLLFNSFCLDHNFEAMLDLWLKLFKTVTLEDVGRFKTLVNNMAANLVSGVTHMGHYYAMMCAGSQVSPLVQRQEISAGLTHISEMKNLAGQGDLGPVLGLMQEIATQVFNKNNLRVAVNAMPDKQKHVESAIASFLDSLPGTPRAEPEIWSTADLVNVGNARGIHHIFPIPVNFAAKSIPVVPYTHPDYSTLQVLAKMLSSKYLHLNIREKGGAYGGGAKVSDSGLFTFYSYRDPNSTATFDIFDNSHTWITDNNFSDQDIDESKIGVFQSLDAPVSPGSRGNLKFVNHVTYDMLQETRQRIKAVTRDDIMYVTEKYLGAQNCAKGARALIGPENKELLSRSQETWQTVQHQ